MKNTKISLQRILKKKHKEWNMSKRIVFSLYILLFVTSCSKYSGSINEKLNQAIVNHDHKSVITLLKKGADPNYTNSDQSDMLQAAYYANDLQIFKTLIDSGAKLDTVSIDLRLSPLSLATSENKIEYVQLLLEKGANVNNVNRDRSSTTALMLAARGNHTDIMNLLIENGAELEKRDNMTDTALGYAVAFGKYEAAKMLIEAGADYNVIGQGTNTLLDWAHFSGNEKLIDYIKSLGVISTSN